MRKYRFAFILCVVWLIAEPIFMYGELLSSDVGARGLSVVTNLLNGSKQTSASPKEKAAVSRPTPERVPESAHNNSKGSNVPRSNNKFAKFQALYKRCQIVGNCYQYPYADINSLFQRTLGKRYHSKGFIRQKNNSIVPCKKQISPDKSQIEETGEKIKRFKTFLDREGIQFLYIQRPSKNNKFNDQRYPFGSIGAVPDEQRADLLLNFCKLENIDYIDLRDELLQTGKDWDESFYKTDHHWKVETGFWAFQTVAQRLQKQYGFDIDEKIIDSSSYSYEPGYQNNYFLGSIGKKTGRYFGELDSITKISPAFPTSYCMDFISANTTLLTNSSHFEGTFEDVCLFEKNLYKTPTTFNLHTWSTYEYYNDGDNSRYVLNKQAPNDKTILLVRDSYACVFSPFMYGICKEFHEIDLRKFRQESLVDYIARVKPDIVLLMAEYVYSPSISFEEKSTYEYNQR